MKIRDINTRNLVEIGEDHWETPTLNGQFVNLMFGISDSKDINHPQ